MPSRDAQGEPLRRIRHALEYGAQGKSGYIERAETYHVRNFLEGLERGGHTMRAIVGQMAEHVLRGGRVKEQDNSPDDDFDTDVWYAVVLPIGGREVFIKFIIEPDEVEEPGILIVSIHWQTK